MWLSQSQTAAKLGCSTDTVNRLIKSGRLPAVMVGNRFKVREPDADAYLAENRVTPEPPEAA